MSQVIRKLQSGGSAPLKIMGSYYDPDTLKRELLGEKALKYAEARGYNEDQTKQFLTDLEDHIDRISNGTMRINDDGVITNTDGSWSNIGKEYKGKGFRKKDLTPEELKNNRSMAVTTYMINGLKNGAFTQSTMPSSKYTMNFDSLFKEKFHPNMSFNDYSDSWSSLDEIDSSNKRGTKNRLSALSTILVDEANKLDNDNSYRNKFLWDGWETNWNDRQKVYTTKLREAASRLADGSYTDDDKRYLISLGINLSKYLSSSDSETSKLEQDKQNSLKAQEKAIQQKEQELLDNNKLKYGNAFQEQLPWETGNPVLWWEGTSYEYGSPEYNELIGNNEEAEKYVGDIYNNLLKTQLDPYNYSTANDYQRGYKYGVDISDYFSELKGLPAYVLRKDPFNNNDISVRINGNPYQIIKKDNNYYAKPLFGNSKEYKYLGPIIPGAQSKYIAQTVPSNNYFEGKDLNDREVLAKYFVLGHGKRYRQDFWKEAKTLYDWVKSGKGNINIEADSSKPAKQAVRVDKEGNKYYLILEAPGVGFFKYEIKPNTLTGKLPENLSVTDLGEVGWSVYKEGGVIKAQAGTKLSGETSKNNLVKSQENVQENNSEDSTPIYASLSSKENKKNQFLSQKELTTTDQVRLGSAIVDLTSVVAGFVPGLNIASTVTGAASSLTDFGADMADLANDREGVTFLDSLGTLGLNLGMDAVSLLPGLKSMKAGSALKTIAKYAPHIAGAIQTYNLITDDNLKQSVMDTLRKVGSLKISTLNTQDFRNLAYLGRTILGTKGLYNQAKSSIKKSTDNRIVSGHVKVNGESIKVEATVPKGDLSKFKSNTDVAKKALLDKANSDKELLAKLNKDKQDGDLTFKDSDISVDKSAFRASTRKEYIDRDNAPYTPKKVFEGWFGSEGKNPWFSDYSITKNNRFWANQYGIDLGSNKKESIKQDTENTPKENTVRSKENVENKRLVEYIKRASKDFPEIQNKILEKSDDEILKLYKSRQDFDNEAGAIIRNELSNLPIVVSNGKYFIDTGNSTFKEVSPKTLRRYSKIINTTGIKASEYIESLNEALGRSNNTIRNYTKAAKQAKAQYDEQIDKQLKEIKKDRINRYIDKSSNPEPTTIKIDNITYTYKPVQNTIQLKKPKKPLTGMKYENKREILSKVLGPIAQKDFETRRAIKNKERKKASESNYYKIANIIGRQTIKGWGKMSEKTKIQYIQDNKEFFDNIVREYRANEYFKKLYPEKKFNGGIIPKYRNSGVINYLDYSKPFIDDTDFYDVTGIDRNQSFKGWEGNSNTKTYNSGSPTLNYSPNKYDSNHMSTGNMTPQDIIDEQNRYYMSNNSSNIFGDVRNAYNTWRANNSNKSINDFVNYYNSSIAKLRSWGKEKSSLAYNTSGQADNNKLFNTLYKSYTVGYDPKQEDFLGGGTYRRIPNQFNNLEYLKQYRQGIVGNTNLWIDNAGYLRTGNYGEVSTTPLTTTNNTSNSNNSSKTSTKTSNEYYGSMPDKVENKPAIDWFNLLGTTNLISGITANILANDKVMQMKPTLKQPIWLNGYIFGNYLAKSRAEQSAGELNSNASTPISSDARLAYLGRQEANYKGNQLIQAGNKENFDTYWKSRDNVRQIANSNLISATNTANENVAAANAMRSAKLKMKADLISSIVSGNIIPRNNELRSYIAQNNAIARQAKLDYAEKLNLMNYNESKLAIAKKYLDEAKNSGMETSGKTDDQILEEYLTLNPIKRNSYSSELMKLNKDYSRQGLDTITSISRLPINLGFTITPEISTFDSKKMEYVPVNKKGGSISTLNKMKLQELKDFNKKLLSDSKSSIKNIMEDKKEFSKMYRSMSAGTLALIKKAIK